MDIDDILAAFQIFDHVSDIDKFQSWIRTYHKIEDFEPLFLGYRYFLEICGIRIVDEISEDFSLNLEMDDYFSFACNADLPLDEIPNSCEKVIVIKNIWRYFEPIKNAKDWAELKTIIHQTEEISKIFREIFKNANVTENFPEKEISRFAALHYTHIFFNDTSRLKPAGAVVGLIKLDIDSIGSDFFKGYAYTLEYLWYQLLEKNEFQHSLAKNIHNPATGLSSEDLQRITEIYSHNDYEDPAFQENAVMWATLDQLFQPLFEKCLAPKFREYHTSSRSHFIVRDNISKSLIFPLLDRTYINEPYYFSDNSNDEARFKKIDYHFKWLPVTYIDSGKVHDAFGTYAFIPFLLGLTSSENVSSNNKIEILRIKHPEDGVSGYFYSYGILNKSQYFDEQGMGWIIFLTCGTDFSGHGGSMHTSAEKCIREIQKRGILDAKEITIDENAFRRYLKERTETSVSDSTTPVETLIEFGESQLVEFKSSLLWSYEKNQISNSTEYEVVRTIAAFLNSSGGTLLIGVDKNKNIVGLDKDYAQLKQARRVQNRDGFEIRLNEVLNKFFGRGIRLDIDVIFERLSEKEICRVIVKPTIEPIFLVNSNNSNHSEFIVRSGNQSQLLMGKEITSYITKHWNYKKR
ncbi:putative transcriptional regulator [Methanoregula boonei 6A8]|jgi:hypothetical protein|uniref:Putative transcriptional regulator n=1 Tax=Methanoregula boonei (strain DSM 21154 / JCM 14090 / 6A8) TaxID=456442 RepID=A7I4Z8_METB6|nr:ATP-binding protein [Methanoregula boonei]ABS54809.1 putative transcriptional regulator [Methanoregula boonei 6A8]